MYDFRYAGVHTDDKRKDGDQDNQQVSQAKQAKTHVSFGLVDIGKRQEVDDGRECNAHRRQTKRTNQRDQ